MVRYVNTDGLLLCMYDVLGNKKSFGIVVTRYLHVLHNNVFITNGLYVYLHGVVYLSTLDNGFSFPSLLFTITAHFHRFLLIQTTVYSSF